MSTLSQASKATSQASKIINAIFKKEFEVFYQPQWCHQRRQFVSAEALIRWKANDTYRSPADFLPEVSEAGLMPMLGVYTFEQACVGLNKFDESGIKLDHIAINFTYEQLCAATVVESIASIMLKHKIDGRRIVLEITEAEEVACFNQIRQIMDRLQTFGITFALDDFCTGFSAIDHLRKLPINIIKIDKSFVDEIEHSKVDYSICKNLINMAHDLQLDTIAEGVETQEQAELLQNMGIGLIQGYFYAKPVDLTGTIQLILDTEYSFNHDQMCIA